MCCAVENDGYQLLHHGVTMKIQITNHVMHITARLKERIQQRLGLALGRFADRISVAAVKFVIAKLPGGLQERRCVIEVVLCKKIKVEAGDILDADLFASVDRAVYNATRRVALAIEQE